MTDWLAITQGALTSVIAIITTYIAVQQWKATNLKMRIERYDRRLKIYQETHKFITIVTSEVNPELREMFAFETATAEADFIFPPEIRVYLDEIFFHANKLRLANTQAQRYSRTRVSEYDHNMINETFDAMDEHVRWFMDQPQVAKEKFKPYMDLTE